MTPCRHWHLFGYYWCPHCAMSSMMAALLLPKMAPGSQMKFNKHLLGGRQAIPKRLASLASHITITCLTFYIQLHQWTVNKHPGSSRALSFETCHYLNLLSCLSQKLTCKHCWGSSVHPVWSLLRTPSTAQHQPSCLWFHCSSISPSTTTTLLCSLTVCRAPILRSTPRYLSLLPISNADIE